MMTDAQLPEPEGAEGVFASFHGGEGLSRNRPTVFNAGRQAS